MKVIVFVSAMGAASAIGKVIESTRHHVVATIMNPDSLNYATAQLTPHALVAEDSHHLASSQAITSYRSIYPDVLIWACHLDDLNWQADLVSFLDRPRKKAEPRPYAQGPRVVYHAAPLIEVSSVEKLKRPSYESEWKKECMQQEARFVMMLQAGRERHVDAVHYYRCLQAQAPGLFREISYRIVHGSYKAYWGRDLAARWLGLLCYYVVGAELDHLPAPMTPGPTVDYIAHEMSEEGLYALTLILMRGVSPAMEAEIRFLGAARFRQQSESELVAECLRLFGFAKLLAQVGTALVRGMTQWLDPNGTNIGNGRRSDKRQLGLLRDFYRMPYILHSPHPLDDTLAGYHAGTTYVPTPPCGPSFRQWRQIFLKESGQKERKS